MYSGMRSTSALYPSYPYHRKQSSDEKPQPGFGEHHYEQFNDQLHPAMNPSYLTPASYTKHQNQNHGFGVQQSLMTNNGPFYHPVKNSSYSTLTSNPMHQNQNCGFGVQQSSMTNTGPLHHQLKDPSYSTPTSYLMHQNQSHVFSVQQSSMTNNRPFYHPGFSYHPSENAPTYPVHQPAAAQAQEAPTYPVYQSAVAQAQEASTYPLRQPATAQAQEAPNYPLRQSAAAQAQEAPTYLVHQPVAAQAHQIEMRRIAEEEVLEVKLDCSIFSTSKPRLRWTPELHERFIRAATELGGLTKATPKAILVKMNVRGLTLDHLKSHLQKTRDKYRNYIPVEEIIGHGIQNNANKNAPFTEYEHSSSNRPNYETDTKKYGSLLRSSELPNYQQNLRNALGEDHANNVDFKDFDLY